MHEKTNPYRPPNSIEESPAKLERKNYSVRRVALWGACVGSMICISPVIWDVIDAIATGRRDQGQLYYEDGPTAFLAISLLIAFILGVFGAIIGALIGAYCGWVLDSLSSDESG